MKQIVLVLAVLCLTGVFAAEKTITVEAGETMGLPAALSAAGWTTALSSDGKSLFLKPVGGTMILVR